MSEPKRGGGTAANKSKFKPNLSAANKRESTANVVQPQPNNFAMPTPRGGRGRNQRPAAPRSGPAVIKTAGVFSQGLAPVDRERNELTGGPRTSGGSRAPSRQSLIGGSLGDIKMEPIDGDTTVTSSIIVDNADEDRVALRELFKEAQPFIADLPRADTKPIDIQRHMCGDDKAATVKANDEFPASVLERMRRAGTSAAPIDDDISKYMLVQLPPGLDHTLFADAASESATATTTPLDKPEGKAHCLSRVPAGRIGRLQVMSSGRVYMCVGDQRYLMQTAMPVDCRQEVMSIRLPPEGGGGQGTASTLGTVGARLNITADVHALVTGYRHQHTSNIT